MFAARAEFGAPLHDLTESDLAAAGTIFQIGVAPIVGLFRDVLLYASELGLLGKEHFAVDGCKLASNASKEWSGTHQELEERRKKLEGVAERIVARHRQRDEDEEAGRAASEAKKVERYRRKI